MNEGWEEHSPLNIDHDGFSIYSRWMINGVSTSVPVDPFSCWQFGLARREDDRER